MSIIFKVKESEENTVKEESKSYQQLVDFLLADQVALFCKIMTMKLINDNSSWVQFVSLWFGYYCTQLPYGSSDSFLFEKQTVRVVESASALARKVHLYELLALLQKTVDK